MKRILLSLVMLLSFIAHSQNTMSLSSGEGNPQDVVEIELSITNSDNFIAFQTEIPLGDNLAYVENSAVLYRNQDHQLIASVVNGTLKIYSFSLSSSFFSGKEGKIVSFQLKLGNEPGNVVLKNTKAKIVNRAGEELSLTTVSGSIDVKTPKIEITTSSINYGHIPIRSSYNKTITVKNVGNEPLTVSNLLFSNETLSCPSFAEKQISVGSSASFTIVYSPITAGSVNYKITVVSDASNGNQMVDVTADPYSVNELHLAKVSAFCDSIVDISIKVNNMDELTGFQFCVKMPSALQYQNNSFELTSRKNDHLGFASMRNDTLVILAYSPSNSFFSDNDGVIANFKVKVQGSSGTYYLYPKKTILTNAEAENVISSENHGYVTVKSPKISANTIYELPASSVTEILNGSFNVKNNGNAPLRIDSVKFDKEYLTSSTIYPLTINSSKSDNVNITCNRDVEGDINAVMRIYSNDPINGLHLVTIKGNRYEPNGLVIDFDEIVSAQYLDVLVGLDNYSSITAIQADFSYPKEYYTISSNDVVLLDRCYGYTKTSVSINDSTMKILIFSMNNEIINGHEGNVFRVRLTRKDNADNQYATVSLKNVVLSDVKGVNKNTFTDQIASLYLMSNVSVAVNSENMGSATGGGVYHKGGNVTVTATPNETYRFVSWTLNGEVISTDAQYSFVLTNDINLVANFTLLDYDVIVSVNPENSGTATGSGNYLHGDNVTLTATPNTGYRFVNWTENGEVISEEREYSFIITNERNIVANFTLLDYDVIVSVNPENSGVATGAGNYIHGDEVTLTATPNVGYRFVNWTENGNVVSEESEYSFTITNDRELVANFTLLDYDVIVNVNPENSGTATGSGNYLHGDNVTLVATPNTGYRFVNWTENGEVISEESEYSFTITNDRELVANFTLLDYDVIVNVNPENSGTATGSGNYIHGDEVTLTATPNTGYRFVNWTENGEVVSSDMEFVFTITSNINLVANFELLDYDVILNISPENAGAVTGSGNYLHGDEVTVTATPNVGYRFVNWTENGNVVSEESECSFTITNDRELVANFTLLDYDINVTINPINSGVVTGEGNYYHGDEVSLTAIPNVGYRFVNWTENGEVVSEETTYTFVISPDRNLVANFELLDYDVTLSVSPENAGAVIGSGNYLHGDEVTVTATPNTGYRFVNWTENGNVVSEESEYSFVLTNDRELVANFTLLDYDVIVNVNPENSGTVTGSGNYLHGDEVTVTATPNTGYRFVNWTENGNVVSEESEYSFTITNERNIVANFTLLDYDVIVSVNPENSGTATGAGNYIHGNNVTLTATPNVGYKFVNWTEDGEVVSEESEYSFTITSERELVANFTLLDYDVIVNVNPENSGTATGSGNYLHGDNVTLIATPNVGYKFVNWTEDGEVVSEESEYSFTITNERNIVANFTLLDYDVTITIDIEGAGEGTGAGNYFYGDYVTVCVTANEGYRFVSWTENEEVVSTEAEYTFIITSNRDLVANFTLSDYDVIASVNPEDAGIVTGEGNYIHGDEVTMTAIPNAGYKFINWTENGELVSTDVEYVFEITDDRVLVANFELLTYEVVVSVNIDDAGVVTGAGIYTHGDNVTLTAMPNENYKFVNWTENDVFVSEEQTYVFEISSDRNIVANFISTEGVDDIFVESFSIYPNPANRNNEINLGMTFDRVEVYNSLGVKVAEYANTDRIDGIETTGIYVIRVFNDEKVRCCKLGIRN